MSGVRVKFLKRDEVLPRLEKLAQELLASRSDVLEVSLFGSLARGDHVPRSDADIYILLQEDSRRFVDRIPEFLDYFTGTAVPVEVFPYTVQEVAQMRNSNFIKRLKQEKIVLASIT